MSRSRQGICPSLTKTEQLRQAKSAALITKLAQKEKPQVEDAFHVRRRIVRPEPKKVDFHKPGMTKAMLARRKQAEKFLQEYERKHEAASRTPRRIAAPIGGDARMGRETSPSRGRYTPSVTPQKPISAARRGAIPKRPKSPEQAIPKKTADLAKVMNADIIQAEQIGTGPVTNIVIPPGVVNAGHTTVVNITPPSTADQPTDIGTILATNRAMQSISDNLEEQEISESVTVQTKLADLQQARRDFVFAVASIGGSSINLDDISPPSPLSETPPLSPRAALLQVRVPGHIVNIPDLDDIYLQPEYGLDHPDILAARAHMEKIKLNIKAREAAKRAQEELERLAAIEQISDELQLNIPFDDEQFPPTLRQQIPYHHPEFDAEELERFFDVERFPPCPQCGPPPGKEGLHRDLWDLEDPWYIPPQSNEPDLIQFD